MADSPTIDNGGLTDYTVASDDITIASGPAGQVQYVKLADGTPNGTTPISGGEQGLWVVTRRDLLTVDVTSGGLTTATTAYSAGDQLGTQFTVANAARVSGGTGTIVGVQVIDAADVTGPIDVAFFNSSVSLATDNVAFAVSDADALKLIGIVPLASWDIGNNRVAQMFNMALAYTCSGGTSLFAGLITRTGHTFFGAATDLRLRVDVERN